MKKVFRDFLWIFKYVKAFRFRLFGIILAGAAASLLSVGSSAVSKHLIDTVTSADKNLEPLKWIIPVMVGIFIITLAINSFVSYASSKISLHFTYKLKQDIFDKLLVSDWLSLSRYHSGDLVNRMTSDANAIVSVAVEGVPAFINLFVRFVAAFLLILYYDPVIGIVALLSGPVIVLFTRLFGRKIRKFNRESQEALSANQSFIQEAYQNILIVKSFSLSEMFTGRLRSLQERHYDISMDKNKFSILCHIALSVLYQIISYFTLGFCAYRLFTGQISFGEMTMFLSLVSQVQGPFTSLTGMLPRFVSATSSAERIIELLELPSETVPKKKLQLDGAPSVEFRDVTASYGDRSDVLENINLTAPAGKITAIIGPSGAGKTTLIRILLGLLTPKSGEVTLCAGNHSETVGADTRSAFSYVPQGNTLFSGTIADNLRLGAPEATDEEIIDALKLVCAWDFVSELPDTINTQIGERSLGLSEGQAQRISIARAIIRKAPVILLDEVTSALDAQTELQVLENIRSTLSSSTCIVVTHRTAVFPLCSKIYRISAGAVTECPCEAHGA